MRAVIDDEAEIFTLINTFTVKPERQDGRGQASSA